MASQVPGHMHGACGLPAQHDALRIPTLRGDVRVQPGDRAVDVGGTGWPGVRRREPVGHRHTDKPLRHGPGADVVVEGRIGCALVTLHEPTTVHEHKHRP